MQSAPQDLTTKIVSAEARIPLQHILRHRMQEEHWTRMAQTLADIEAARLHISYAGQLTVPRIGELLAQLDDGPPGLVIIDPASSLRPASPGSRDQIATDLKAMAVDLQIPLVVTSSLNRSPRTRIDRRPTLDDVSDAGHLVDIADVVLLLYRPDMIDREIRGGEADIIVAKSRLTPTSVITVAFQMHYSRFVDLNVVPNPSAT
jgi:replicative DNA helicase